MNLKKIMALFFAMICLFANFGVVAYADTTSSFVDDGISLAYEIADNPRSTLAIIDSTAYCTSSTVGRNAVRITVTHTLQKYWGLWIWEDVDGAEWTTTKELNSVCLSSSISGLESGKYRVKSVFTLIDNSGKSETITIYSNEKEVA